MDGVTLVSVENGRARYTIKDLARQNAKTQNPLANPAKLADNPNKDALLKYQNVFKSGRSIRDTWVRPNEVYLGPPTARMCSLKLLRSPTRARA